MPQNTVPTKGNLMAAKNTLRLSKQGFEMLDKKRNILIREMMALIDEAGEVEKAIESTFQAAYTALSGANLMMGADTVERLSLSQTCESNLTVRPRSVMGVELPVATLGTRDVRPTYSFYGTTSAFDEAFVSFEKVKQLTVHLAEVENSVYRLAMNIKKTQKRANALQNITIPHYESIVKTISAALEEKDREEYTRLKKLKDRSDRQ